MNPRHRSRRMPLGYLLLAVALVTGQQALLGLTLETRGRGERGELASTTVEVDPRRVGVVVVDMWDWHWCKTSTQRVAALVPRMNACLRAARDLGMTVFICPTDVADNYVGTPMVERVMAIEPAAVPQVRNLQCPPAPDGGGCTCGDAGCLVNYGWDGLHPDLVVGADDLIPNDSGRLYAICRERGLTHLIYLGVHTQVCLLGKSIGLLAMAQAGLHCLLARDLTDAHGRYQPNVETPDDFTEKVVAHFEQYLANTIDFGESLRRNGRWDQGCLVDVVRHAPWGTTNRPHFFENLLVVSLTAPEPQGAEIRYTVDGSDPEPGSAVYSEPLRFAKTVRIRAAGFIAGRRVSLISESFAVRLAAMPPAPEVPLSAETPWRTAGMGHSPSFNDHRYSPGVNAPQKNRSNEGKTLRLHGVDFAHGMGVHAPNQLAYRVEPRWSRFVARAGVDEHLLDTNMGSNLAMHANVIFRVFIDGRLAAESPSMRIGCEPWRFDVPLPAGARWLSLSATHGGDGRQEDLADWVDAGFLLRP